jgi:hypothetical protein
VRTRYLGCYRPPLLSSRFRVQVKSPLLHRSATGQTQTHTPHRWVGAHAADGKEKAEGKLDGRLRRTRDKSEPSSALSIGQRVRAGGTVGGWPGPFALNIKSLTFASAAFSVAFSLLRPPASPFPLVNIHRPHGKNRRNDRGLIYCRLNLLAKIGLLWYEINDFSNAKKLYRLANGATS